LTGESFAGHYIPSIANFLHEKTSVQIAGVAIGNGWVDPFYQYPSYPDFAHSQDIIKAGHAKVLNVLYEVCRIALILETPILSTVICQMTSITIATPVYPEFNMYDVREPCVVPGLCYPDDHLWEVLNSVEYREQFGIYG
jgi:carboxypeptidase C (cathepsin A)